MNKDISEKSLADIRSQILCSIEDAAQLLGIGRSLMIELLNSGEVKRKEIKGRKLVSVADLEEYAQRLDKFEGEYREVKRAKPLRKKVV